MKHLSLAWLACSGAACLMGAADLPSRPVDPGVRAGAPSAGGPVAGVVNPYFVNVRNAFNQEYSVTGDLEPGAGLGPRFNGTSCGGCHAFPAPGGSSPRRNPQIGMAAAHGATNTVPSFVRADGPVVAARLKAGVGAVEPGGVLPLFTVSGRADAYGCTLKQPDFRDAANASLRIPSPVFGAGLIDNIPDTVILANGQAHAVEKRALGIDGRPNIDSDGAIGKFGWKAQHHSLTRFAEEAYQTEMGVRNGGSYSRAEPLTEACYAVYDAAYADPNFAPSYDQNSGAFAFLFTEFMRFLEAPRAVNEFAAVSTESIVKGRGLFETVGCALCHTPTLRTGNNAEISGLNGRDAALYSDLLLHHMGAQLADGIVQERAESDEFRTAPLWGLGQRVFFLHDGRTSDLFVAILNHAGNVHVGSDPVRPSEATGAIDRFRQLGPSEQQAVLNFLRSL